VSEIRWPSDTFQIGTCFCHKTLTFHSKGCCHFSQNYTGDRCACRCNIAPPQLWFCRRHFVKKGIGKKSCFEISCFEISLLMFRKQQFCFEKQHSFNFESCLVASTKSLRNFFVKQTKGCCSLKIIVSFQKPYKFSFQNPFSTNFSNLVLPSESAIFSEMKTFTYRYLGIVLDQRWFEGDGKPISP